MQGAQADDAVAYFQQGPFFAESGEGRGRGLLHRLSELFGNMEQRTGCGHLPFGPVLSGDRLLNARASPGNKSRHEGQQRERACHRNSIACQWVTHTQKNLDG